MRWLGFGARGEHDGVLLVDVRPGVGAAVEDARRLSFADETFDGIEFHHVIEHLTPEDGAIALREIWRVLKPGGRLELSCPDLAACAQTLLAGNLLVLENIFSPHPEEAQRHRWGYTWQTARQALHQARFCNIRALPITEPHELRLVGERSL
jgi:predicted SAM-dependent methyltransferase